MNTKYVSYLLILLLHFNGEAQDWNLKLSSNVEIRSWKLTSTYEKEEKSLQGATIVLTKANQIVSQTTSDNNGDFTVYVPPNGEYILTVSYPGYNTKRFSVNTNNVPPEFAKDNYKPTFSIGGFIMAKPFQGIDYSGLQQPLIRVEFMTKKKVFDHDDAVTTQGLNIVSKIAEAENALIQKFCSTNKAGDVALSKPDCPLAKTQYQNAMSIIPFEAYPVEQLKKVGECLKNKSEAEKKAAEDAANKAIAEKAAAEKAAADKIAADKAAAEKLQAEKSAAAAQQAEKAAAEKAAKEKAQEEKLAKEKAEADKIAKQKEGLAKAKAEDEAEARAIEEKRKEKEAKQKEALANAKAADEAEAKAAAEKKAIKEKEAKEKAAKEKEAMAKAKADDEAEARANEEKKNADRKAKEEEARKKQYEAKSSDVEGEQDKRNSKYSVPQTVLGTDKYKENIKKADDYFKMKRWAEAKTAYEDALKYKADDPYAKSKLEIVDKNLNPPK